MTLQPSGTSTGAASGSSHQAGQTPAWVQKQTTFKFAVGDWILFTVNYESAGWQGRFGLTGLDIPTPLAEDFPAGAEMLTFSSYPAPEPLARFHKRGGLLRYVTRQYHRQYVDLSGTFDQYMAKFSGKSRSTIKRKLRRFQELSGGTIDWRQYRTATEVQQFYELASPLSHRTYQERLLKSGLPQGDAYKERVIQTASEGRIRAFLLFHQGAAVAYLFTSMEDGVLKYDYLGYDPEYAEHSPGTVLQMLAMQSLFEEGCYRAFDFGEGAGQHKELFATGSIQCADIYFMPATIRNCFIMRLHAGMQSTSAAIGKLLQMLRLKHVVRRLIRR